MFWSKISQNQQQFSTLIKPEKLSNNQGYNLVHLKQHLLDEGTLNNEQMEQLIREFTKQIQVEPNMLEITGDTIVIGDIHGQYYDFMKILSQLSNLEQQPQSTILFLGDYVDRGTNSVEVITLIMALKVTYPKKIYLLRGNHQSRTMTTIFNFHHEAKTKYNQSIYILIMDAFDNLPLACLINKKMFCVHGGLSPSLLNMGEINKMDRFKEIPVEGAICDFIWADPVENERGDLRKESVFNDSRQCSIYFGKSLTNKFLKTNSLNTVIRAHEVFPEGYKRCFWGSSTDYPSIVTIFSAPNYCGVYGNKGAILKISKNTYSIKQYREQRAHKLFRYLQVFEWSIPLITDTLNAFTRIMISQISRIYLQGDCQGFHKESSENKLRLLLDYIDKETDIGQKQKKSWREKTTHKKDRNTIESQNNKANDKDRLFNRSHEYFAKEHQRPMIEGGTADIQKEKLN